MAMTIEQVRDWLRRFANLGDRAITSTRWAEMADALDAHLTQPAQAVDVPKYWNAENMERCVRELTQLIQLAGDYDFDEMTVATFDTSIECIRVCIAALPNANGKEGS